jgi:succinate dehydrogenase/fumarate reductase flavoprotein subunit
MKAVKPIDVAVLQTDVVVIGGGLAGMAAAAAARDEGAEVLVLDRTTLGMATNTALSNGVFSGPTTGYSTAAYVSDTRRIGCGLGLPWMAKRIAADIRPGIEWLRKAGLTIEEKQDHYFVGTRGGPGFPGAELARIVADHIRSRSGIRVLAGTRVEQVVAHGGQAEGVAARDGRDRPIHVQAGAVVLAAGGAGAVYRRNDNQKSTLGQGYALALAAGLALLDMEFVQFYPIVLAHPHLPEMMLNPPHPEGSRLVNAAGEDLTAKYAIADLNGAIRNRRDWMSSILFEEGRSGPVFMDYRSVAGHHWQRHPLVLLKNRRFDFSAAPVAVSPAAHYTMVGVRIDEDGQTELEGLFACGEVAWGLHGACRKGGNALSECLVFGRIAGRWAARRALQGGRGTWRPPPPIFDESQGKPSPATPREMRRRMAHLAWNCCGVVREAEGMKRGLAELTDLALQIRALPATSARDRRMRQDLSSMSRVLQAILSASLARRESRGCFLRKDYPLQDDRNWLKNSRVRAAGDPPDIVVSHVPADTDLTSNPPADRPRIDS